VNSTYRLQRLTATIALAVAWCGAFTFEANSADPAPPQPAAAKPNIVFILADDLGYGDLGCYGQKKIKTPAIDRLAAEGTRVLMTGLHMGHTRVRGNFGRVGGVGLQRRVPLEEDDVTVAEVLKAAGYATGITGKWGLGEPNTTGVPNRQGFDRWFGYLNQRNAHSYYPPYLWHNEKKSVLEGNQAGRKEQYSHDLCTDFALRFIRKHAGGPFFLYLPWCIPHAKYEIPSVEPYADRPWPRDGKVHAAMITRMDRDVGRIMALLGELDIDRNTIVFFCSDNGAARRWDGLFDSSGPLRGHKRDMYEGGIRTPMIVRCPGRVPAGAVSDTVWYFADFLPTAADLAGAEVPKNVDGVSVVPTLLGKRQDVSKRFLYWEFFEGGFQQAVRWGNWKAVRRKPGQPLELFDLRVDLSEESDAAVRHPEVVAKIEAYLRTARTESKNWPVAEKVRPSPKSPR